MSKRKKQPNDLPLEALVNYAVEKAMRLPGLHLGCSRVERRFLKKALLEQLRPHIEALQEELRADPTPRPWRKRKKPRCD
jgi:hypothetical protein